MPTKPLGSVAGLLAATALAGSLVCLPYAGAKVANDSSKFSRQVPDSAAQDHSKPPPSQTDWANLASLMHNAEQDTGK